MNFLLLIIAVFVCIYFCYLAAKYYFIIQRGFDKTIKGNSKRLFFSYSLFLAFILIEIPIALFFPAWVSEVLEVIKYTPESTAGLIVIGCCVLVFSVIYGYKHAKSI